jgi:hypothetical protein
MVHCVSLNTSARTTPRHSLLSKFHTDFRYTRNLILLTCIRKAQPFPCRLSKDSQMLNSFVCRSMTTNWTVNANRRARISCPPFEQSTAFVEKISTNITNPQWHCTGKFTPNFTKNDQTLKKLTYLLHGAESFLRS